MNIGLLATGDISVRAAHSLAAHPSVDLLVVVGPAKSKSFPVVDSVDNIDLLMGSGPQAVKHAKRLGKPLVWDGNEPQEGVVVWGGSLLGLTMALASRESDIQLAAAASPDFDQGGSRAVRFPDPIGRTSTDEVFVDQRPVAIGRSSSEFAAALVESNSRRVTLVDQFAFMSGIALAAAACVAQDGFAGPVWGAALPYLEAATSMGLVMAESA